MILPNETTRYIRVRIWFWVAISALVGVSLPKCRRSYGIRPNSLTTIIGKFEGYMIFLLCYSSHPQLQLHPRLSSPSFLNFFSFSVLELIIMLPIMKKIALLALPLSPMLRLLAPVLLRAMGLLQRLLRVDGQGFSQPPNHQLRQKRQPPYRFLGRVWLWYSSWFGICARIRACGRLVIH